MITPAFEVPESNGMTNSVEAKALGGLLSRRTRWGLSFTGWLLILCLCLGGGFVWTRTVFPFLAVTERLPTDVLVVEGWIQEQEIRSAAAEFATGRYNRVFTTGGPVSGTGSYTNEYNTSASVGADGLRRAGVPAERIEMVPSRVMERDRTYGAAVALRDYFVSRQIRPASINVATEAPHARRTRLLFQKALGRDITVGVIALRNPDYDSQHWWQYSEGVRDVVGEALAYIYARFLFSPE